jgi:hypothetical protein
MLLVYAVAAQSPGVVARSGATKQSSFIPYVAGLLRCARNDGIMRRRSQPRPTNGILLAITVMNSTLASSGRLAI